MVMVRFSRRCVRSRTCPANWPQAAAMSSPRVLRVVVMMRACISISAKRRTRKAGRVVLGYTGVLKKFKGVDLLLRSFRAVPAG